MKEVAAAAVLAVVSSIASEADVVQSGTPDDPRVTFGEIYDWKCYLDDIRFWVKGPDS